MVATSAGRERRLEASRNRRSQQERSRPERPEGTPRDASGSPIVAAVDGSAAGSHAAEAATRLARQLGAPLVFVYVRPGPWKGIGEPYYQRRLDAEMASGRRVLANAQSAARREGIIAEGAILEGAPARRVLEFADHRGARLVVLGSRRRRLSRSVSRRVMRRADRPVVVAGAPAAAA
jgi:nucleotide-binding universal stress UspA family protein